MKRSTTLATLALATILTVTGCAWKGSGEVQEKGHRAAYTTYSGKHHIPHRHPACWYLKVLDVEGDTHRSSCLSKGEWDAINVGDAYSQGVENQ